MKNKKFWVITSLVTLLPILLGLLLWDQLPEKIPTHFGIDGAADGWGSKGFAVFGLPLIWLVLHVLSYAALRLDKQNHGHNEKVLTLVGLIFPAMSILFSVIMYGFALGWELKLEMFLFPLLGLMFIGIGNWLPKVKQNSTLGIKLKWTLYSEENWNKTHRFAGFIWVIGGIGFCLLGFLPSALLVWLLPAEVLLLAVVPVVYSWQLARKQKREGTYTESEVSKNLRKHPFLMAVSGVLVTAILVGVSFIMFTGDIRYTCTDTALLIDADFHSDSTIPYDRIDTIEFRAEAPEGTRELGFASARLLMGAFRNDEFGLHTRYSYLSTDACIILICDGDVLILSAESEDATLALYAELSRKVG